ncbi:MAG: hypothetical protein Q4B29_03065 [Candidatus Saccharibacteria bacterium]|nr:hypothetical protein [Candidatus Saccharibacteria bacterium]
MKIAVLGAGAFGTTLGGVLAEKGYDVDYYDSKVEQEKLSDVLKHAKVVVLTVPSKAVPYLLPHLPKNIPLVVATKGILKPTTFDEFKDYMILSGPGFADDIRAHKKTLLTATDKRIYEMFETDYLTFDYTEDEHGVLMCGALKNVYAILAGLVNVKSGTRLHEQFLTEAADEMRAILKANSANPKTVDLACGVGDLRITCDYPSRNYEFGQKLRENPKYQPEKTVEGVSALKRIKRGEIIIPEGMDKMKTLISMSGDFA